MVLPKDRRDNADGTGLLSFIPRPALEKPGRFARPLKWIIQSYEDSVIDVDPEYQRDIVWSEERMSSLVDSLIENYYVPPIIFNRKKRANAADFTLVCVDGKQRISSVMSFYRGDIACSDRYGEKWWFRDKQGCRKNVFSEERRDMFLEKEFLCFEYTELQPAQEEDLFARVQMGIPLTPAEKLRAQSGPFQELAKMFINDFPTIYRLQRDMTRAKDFQLTLACISQIIEVRNIPANTNGIPPMRTSFSNLPKLVQNTGLLDDDTKSHLPSVWRKFKELIDLNPGIFINMNKYLKGTQMLAPIEMIAITVLISVCLEERSDDQILEHIGQLRSMLREKFPELRQTAKEWRETWTFIDDTRGTWSNAPRGMTAIPGSMTEQPARNASSVKNIRDDEITVEPESIPNEQSAQRPRKRTRTMSSKTDFSPQATSDLRTQNLESPPLSVSREIPLRSTSQRHGPAHVFDHFMPLSHAHNSSPDQLITGTGTDKQRTTPSMAGPTQTSSVDAAHLPIASGAQQNVSARLSTVRVPVAPMAPPMQTSHALTYSPMAVAADPPIHMQWSAPFKQASRHPVYPPHGDLITHARKSRTTHLDPLPLSRGTVSVSEASTPVQKTTHPSQERMRNPQNHDVIDLTGAGDDDSRSDVAEKERAGLLSMFQRGQRMSGG